MLRNAASSSEEANETISANVTQRTKRSIGMAGRGPGGAEG
jgi:hypothetical protein